MTRIEWEIRISKRTYDNEGRLARVDECSKRYPANELDFVHIGDESFIAESARDIYRQVKRTK